MAHDGSSPGGEPGHRDGVEHATAAPDALLVGSYGQLLDYVTFADWIFFGLTAAALVVLRVRDARAAGGAADHGFRAPLYPWSVGAFVLAALYVVAGAVASNPRNAARGAVLLLAGVPVFLFWRRRTERVTRAAAISAARAGSRAGSGAGSET